MTNSVARSVCLGDVCDIKSSLVDPRHDHALRLFHVGGANIEATTGRLIGLKSAEQEELISGKYLFEPRDVLYSKIRPYLRKVALPSFQGLCSADIYPLRPAEDQLDREFLFYLLLSDEFTAYANRVSNRAGMPKINREQLFAFKAVLPPLAEQRRIVGRIRELIERVDEIRRLRQASAADVDRVAGAIFADFVEDHVKAAGVPTVNLGTILTDTQYGTSSKANTVDRGVRILRMGNIKDGHLDTEDLKHIELPAPELARYKLRSGDILINRTNSLELVGKAAVFNLDGGPWVYASYLVRLVVDKRRALPEYVAAVINSRIGRAYVLQTARRAIGMVNINVKEIRAMPVPLPTLDAQAAVVSRMADARLAVQAIRANLPAFNAAVLRSAVLRRAFAGEL